MSKWFKILRGECYLLLHKKSFWLSFWLVMLYSMYFFVRDALVYISGHGGAVFEAGYYFVGMYRQDNKLQEIFFMVFPLLAAFPFSFSYAEERRKRVMQYTMPYASMGRYLYAKLTVAFLGGFCIIGVPYLLNAILNIISFGANKMTPFGVKESPDFYVSILGTHLMPFLNFYVEHPLWYIVLFSAALGIFAGLLSAFSCALGFYLHRIPLLIFLPTYLLFFLTARYSRIFGGVNLQAVIIWCNGWGDNYGRAFAAICGVLLVSSILLVMPKCVRKDVGLL